MRDLLSVQRGIAAALRDSSHVAQATPWLGGDAALASRRLAIYRSNVHATITKALAAAYPVIQQVVGEEFFEGLARVYLQAEPSLSGDLYDYGESLAPFVTQFEHTQSLPYLSDLARLEWAAHRAYGAPDAPPFDIAAMSQVAPERQSALRFSWAAGTAVIASAHPIVRIWQLHQPDYSGEFSVDWSASQCALVTREGLRVVVSALEAGAAAFIGSTLAGATLGQATDAAFAAEPGFDLGSLLSRAIESNHICGFTADEDFAS